MGKSKAEVTATVPAITQNRSKKVERLKRLKEVKCE